jgi:hypothetical protein
MTAAVMGGQALARSLEDQHRQNDLTGLAGSFQVQLKQSLASAWALATREDQRWPSTKVAERVDSPLPHRRQTSPALSQRLPVGTPAA